MASSRPTPTSTVPSTLPHFRIAPNAQLDQGIPRPACMFVSLRAAGESEASDLVSSDSPIVARDNTFRGKRPLSETLDSKMPSSSSSKRVYTTLNEEEFKRLLAATDSTSDVSRCQPKPASTGRGQKKSQSASKPKSRSIATVLEPTESLVQLHRRFSSYCLPIHLPSVLGNPLTEAMQSHNKRPWLGYLRLHDRQVPVRLHYYYGFSALINDAVPSFWRKRKGKTICETAVIAIEGVLPHYGLVHQMIDESLAIPGRSLTLIAAADGRTAAEQAYNSAILKESIIDYLAARKMNGLAVQRRDNMEYRFNVFRMTPQLEDVLKVTAKNLTALTASLDKVLVVLTAKTVD